MLGIRLNITLSSIFWAKLGLSIDDLRFTINEVF